MGLVLTLIAAKTWLQYNSDSKALQSMQHTPVSHIADLRSLLPPPQDYGGAGGNRTRDLEQANPLVIIRGKVQPTASVESSGRNEGEVLLTTHHSGHKAVIFEKKQTCLYNEWRGLFGWSAVWRALFVGGSLKEKVTSSVRKVPFVLIENDGLQNVNFVHINLDKSSHKLPLITVYHHLQPVQASPYTVIQAIFGGGYLVGLLDEEKILPPGKEITAVGQLYLSHDGHPAIKSCKWLPYFLSDLTKDQLVEDITSGKAVQFWGSIFFSTAAIVGLSYAGFRNWHRWREWRRQRQARQPREDPPVSDAVDDGPENVPDGQLCIVCLMRRRRSVFIPCGHHVCCVRCAQLVERDSNPKCPVCRQNVRNSVRIFDS